MIKKNIILMSDSYKFSQFNQYPPETEYVYSYIESRGGKYDSTVFFGLQAFIMEYLCDPVTKEMVEEAKEIIEAHGEPFNYDGWMYIVEEHNGYLPLEIKAVPEGTVVPYLNVLATIVNTDPKCYWLTSFIETPLLRAIWYPTTVATNSREIKKIILDALEKSGDPETILFKLHDFGDRGVSSRESAGLGGAAHLVNFYGTDTVEALLVAREYYFENMAGFSVPAMEHSTVTSWGRDKEVDSYRNMIKMNAKPGGIVACVSDSYDIYNACKLWGTVLKDDVINSGATVVIRPDSGEPWEVVLKCIQILDEYFGHIVNEKGYKVLNNVRILQGDGINIQSIIQILAALLDNGYSADNVAFGQGGALLQIVNRDDQKFAMKCSAIKIANEISWRDVFKDPITDFGKRSKKGILKLIFNKETENFETLSHHDSKFNFYFDVMLPVFRNGKCKKFYTFQEIRKNASL
jgi:nicotinamide phosphoribosyltransferase